MDVQEKGNPPCSAFAFSHRLRGEAAFYSFGRARIGEPQHRIEVNEWLKRLDRSSDAVQMYDMEGYIYYSVKGYKDVSVSYIFEESRGNTKRTLKTTFIRGNDTDTLFVKVKYDAKKCCDLKVIDEQP